MKRALSLCAALLKDQNSAMANSASDLVNLVKNFKDWKFKPDPNYALLPIDENPEYNVPMAVKNAVYSKVPVEPLTGKISLVCASGDALSNILDLDPSVAETEEFVAFISGNYLPEGGLTVCHRYGGYQFGFWADQLGDGRAHILGEYVNRKGESWQPQLKGSGETPYSRFGDGRAVLRSSIREMVASEACHFLNIPTTRAAALVVSDSHLVWRDKSYSGAAKQERAAAVMRLAQCWARVGSLEILDKRHEPELLRRLVDFIIEHHFPEIKKEDSDRYVQWFTAVAHRNLDMVATWQGYGFTHGVLNTDNTSLLGLTIDYGPYGFLDHYYESYVPNTSDDMGRYAFNKQPSIIIWNLEKLSQALSRILSDDDKAKVAHVVTTLQQYVDDRILSTYLLKLGLSQRHSADQALVNRLLELMQETTADFTCTFRQMAELDMSELDSETALESKWSLKKCSASSQWKSWVRDYRERVKKEGIEESERRARMLRVNPAYVPRNWLLEEAIKDAEKDDFEKVRFLLRVLCKPFDVDEEAERRGFSAPPPSWAFGLKLSCSS